MKNDSKPQISEAIRACLEKKAEEITILELEQGSGAFTDYFVVCSGSNPRQVQAISDEVEDRLEQAGMRPNQIEGYKQAALNHLPHSAQPWLDRNAERIRKFATQRRFADFVFLGQGAQILRS